VKEADQDTLSNNPKTYQPQSQILKMADRADPVVTDANSILRIADEEIKHRASVH
jgi:hypothetical protein